LIVLLNPGHSTIVPTLLEDLADVTAAVRSGRVVADAGPVAYTV
jgi:hypothetical protein